MQWASSSKGCREPEFTAYLSSLRIIHLPSSFIDASAHLFAHILLQKFVSSNVNKIADVHDLCTQGLTGLYDQNYD